jgi:hypothetical protein
MLKFLTAAKFALHLTDFFASGYDIRRKLTERIHLNQ